MELVDVNYLAILVAAVAAMVLGSIWYAPPFLGKKWMHIMEKKEGKDMKKMQKDAGKAYLAMFVGTLVMAYVFSYFVGMLGLETVTEGMRLGFWVWLGFVGPMMLSAALFNGRDMRLFYIEGSFQLLNVVVMGGILAGWM